MLTHQGARPRDSQGPHRSFSPDPQPLGHPTSGGWGRPALRHSFLVQHFLSRDCGDKAWPASSSRVKERMGDSWWKGTPR